MSKSKSKRRAVDCASKKNEALRTTACGTQYNLPPSESSREYHSTNNSDLTSSAGNLRKCQIKLRKLPICSKHGTKIVQLYSTRLIMKSIRGVNMEIAD